MQVDAPIGVFDSGIGGLTVARALLELLPEERLVYYGDTAHLPYGDKSETAIRHYAHGITAFLREQNCKAIVIACNTASAVAYDSLINEFPDIPIYNVIDPVVDYVTLGSKEKSVGVIGTRTTIKSDIYRRKIKDKRRLIKVSSMATPLLAPMVEEGFLNNAVSEEVLKEYLWRKPMLEVDQLILGCTHYPLLIEQIRRVISRDIEIVDSAHVVAKKVAMHLEGKSLLNRGVASMANSFFLSDYTPVFESNANRFFGEKVTWVERNIW
jgi:glutamate racemase